jgi:hypothetical protein
VAIAAISPRSLGGVEARTFVDVVVDSDRQTEEAGV